MSNYDLDIRGNVAQGKPVLFWSNRGDPFIVASQNVAQSGNVAIVRAKKSNLVGAPMIVRFTLAKASHIVTWQGMAKNNAFETTSLDSTFVTGHRVIFNVKRPIEFDNMILKDQNYDIHQSIFDYTSPDYRRGFDVWRGVLSLIIAT